MNGRAQIVLALGLGLALLVPPSLAHADGSAAKGASASPEVGSPEATSEARSHFARGRELYQSGAYREAIVELDAARALDPKAKELVYNLAIVHEKLGEIDEALRYARLYLQMDLEPAEHARGEGYVKRLEGAKAEVDARRPPPEAPHAEAPRQRGRLDAATIAVGVVTVGAAVTGTVFGVKALGDRPSTFVTTPTVTVGTLQTELNKAHNEAVVADVCFGGAIAAAVATAVLYFGRYRDVTAPEAARSASLTLTPLVQPSSGSLLLGGTF